MLTLPHVPHVALVAHSFSPRAFAGMVLAVEREPDLHARGTGEAGHGAGEVSGKLKVKC